MFHILPAGILTNRTQDLFSKNKTEALTLARVWRAGEGGGSRTRALKFPLMCDLMPPPIGIGSQSSSKALAPGLEPYSFLGSNGASGF